MESNMIGDKIATARKKANLSQAQLAEQLFISAQAVGKWERGESIPDIVTISKLAKILSVDLNYFSENAWPDNLQNAATDKTEAIPANTKNLEDKAQERPLLTNFNGNALAQADFAGVSAPGRKFIGSDLCGVDFSGADLSGSVFTGSDAQGARFDGSNLSDCKFTALNLKEASFIKTILVRTVFSASDLAGARFSNTNLIDARLTATDLTQTRFEHCSFSGVDFKSSDLNGQNFEGQSFVGVKFDNASLKGASFRGATLKNVSFRPTFALTNRYYKTLKTIHFEGATMDKLTFAALKGVGVEMKNVKVV